MSSFTPHSCGVAMIVVTTAVSPLVAQPLTRPQPPTPPGDRASFPYWGQVTQLTKLSITIQGPNLTIPPKVFGLSDDLASGKMPSPQRPLPGRPEKMAVLASMLYRITDVRVGDEVTIDYSQFMGRVTCNYVTIEKRAGGRVPPLPEEAEAIRRGPPRPAWAPPDEYIPYHEWRNAHWDLVDHGISNPPHFGRNREFATAPPPREVVRPAGMKMP